MVARWRDGIQRDTRANQPAATAVDVGTLYIVTDEDVLERSNGTTWDDVPVADATHAADGDAHHNEDHAARHASGGADAIKLDDLATPDDNTDLDATATEHGLLPKLSGTATEYMDGSGAWSTPAGAAALDDLSDVDTDKSKTPADGDVLTFDGTDWNAEAGGGGGASAIDDLSDVDTDKSKTPADGDVLTFDGTDWNAETPTGGGGGGDLVILSVDDSTSRSISNTTWTQAAMGAAGTDSEGGWSDANDEWTVPAGMSGWYFYKIAARFAGDNFGERYVALRVDDVQKHTWTGLNSDSASTGINSPEQSGLVYLEAGETVQVYVYHAAGHSLDLTYSQLQLHKLDSGNVSVGTGTAFPVGPATGDRYRRSDLDYQLFFYDGARWLSEQVFTAGVFLDAGITADKINIAVPLDLAPAEDDSLDLYAMDLTLSCYAVATQDGSNYWTGRMRALHAGTIDETYSVTTAAVTNGAYERVTANLNDVVDSDFNMFDAAFVKTGSPGALSVASLALRYRLIAT